MSDKMLLAILRAPAPDDAIALAQLVNAAREAADRMHADRELLAAMMVRQGLATGHGDTIADLVEELEAQIVEMRAEGRRHYNERNETRAVLGCVESGAHAEAVRKYNSWRD